MKEELKIRIEEGKRRQWHETLGEINEGKPHYKGLWRMVHVVDGTLPAATPNPRPP